VFFDEEDYKVYLSLLREEAAANHLRVVGYCLMPNHIHIVGVPQREESLSNSVGKTHFRYTAHTKLKYRRFGHLWQSRFYSCPMDENHTIRALCYVELNPVRASLTSFAWDYTWSSARAHCNAHARSTIMDIARWRQRFTVEEWREFLIETAGDTVFLNAIRKCTHKGRPLGDAAFQARAAAYTKERG
jgi:putative transposase